MRAGSGAENEHVLANAGSCKEECVFLFRFFCRFSRVCVFYELCRERLFCLMRDLELQQNWRRWRLRVGRGAESEQQLAGAGTCESICNFVLRSQVLF